MSLATLLGAEQILPALSVADRWQAIDRLVDLLVETGKVPAASRENVRRAVKDREASKSTGIGYGIALPHASVACITEPVAALARLRPPVDFQALDSQPVSLCVLFLTPQGQFQIHLQTLSALARFLNNKEHRQQIEAATTAAEIHALFAAA